MWSWMHLIGVRVGLLLPPLHNGGVLVYSVRVLSSSPHQREGKRERHITRERESERDKGTSRESEATMPRPPAAERPRLTLEDYILFFTTHNGRGLTIDHLNQILFMHGFSKCHHSNKVPQLPKLPLCFLGYRSPPIHLDNLMQWMINDALNSLDLLRPRRSTVSTDGAAPPPRAAVAVLSTEDVRRDIEELGWRACPVGSALSIRAGASPVPLATMLPGSAAVQHISPPSTLDTYSPRPPPSAPGVAAKRKRGRDGQGEGGD
uniref:Uncharacterized protein n=1 Tax=Avena sativa TaxID=4498 RepID=A0ACD5Z725_AVESA